MEITCTRCHQTVQDENRYCPACGLPQLVYTADSSAGPALPERGIEAVLDADSVDWKPAIRAALIFAVPAGLLSSALSPLGALGLIWMAAAAGWAVLFYLRTHRRVWITIGAGARIGLVTGLLAGWLAFAVSGGELFVERFVFHQSSQIDAEWKARIDIGQQLAQQLTAGMAPSDAAEAQAARAQLQAFYGFMLSPAGHAGWQALIFARNSVFFLIFAVAGGAFGARLLARTRRPEA